MGLWKEGVWRWMETGRGTEREREMAAAARWDCGRGGCGGGWKRGEGRRERDRWRRRRDGIVEGGGVEVDGNGERDGGRETDGGGGEMGLWKGGVWRWMETGRGTEGERQMAAAARWDCG